MPKIVDHEQRRAEIADALWRVIRRDGVGAASVRAVAAEAGWSPGAIRHYFTTQSELLAFATELVIERIGLRSQGVQIDLTSVEGLTDVLGFVLPLDDTSREESEVWLAMVATSRTDPTLRPITKEAHRRLRGLVEQVVVAVEALPDTPTLDRALEVDRLHGLVDGLAVQGMLYPEQLPPARIRAAVRAHLTQLASPARSRPARR